MKKCLVISYTAPADNTGAGGPVGVFGNVACLAKAGFETINLVFGKKINIIQNYYQVSFLETEGKSVEIIKEDLRLFLNNYEPDIIWLHHYWVWEYFEPFSTRFPFVLLSGDPDWELLLLHRKTRQKLSNPVKELYHAFLFHQKLRKAKLREIEIFQKSANAGGTLACWCAYSVKRLNEVTGLKIVHCALAYPDWGKREIEQCKYLLMLGNSDGANTRVGLKYFMNKIWASWTILADTKDLPKIRMVGGGKIPSSIKLPENSKIFEYVGFVSNLETEWNQAFATLVPVPVGLGFRTRIIESWSKGVPVIAHPSAKESIPEALDRENIVFFTDSYDLLNAILFLRNRNNYQYIIANGLQTFKKHYEVSNAYLRYADLSNVAINNFRKL